MILLKYVFSSLVFCFHHQHILSTLLSKEINVFIETQKTLTKALDTSGKKVFENSKDVIKQNIQNSIFISFLLFLLNVHCTSLQSHGKTSKIHDPSIFNGILKTIYTTSYNKLGRQTYHRTHHIKYTQC